MSPHFHKARGGGVGQQQFLVAFLAPKKQQNGHSTSATVFVNKDHFGVDMAAICWIQRIQIGSNPFTDNIDQQKSLNSLLQDSGPGLARSQSNVELRDVEPLGRLLQASNSRRARSRKVSRSPSACSRPMRLLEISSK